MRDLIQLAKTEISLDFWLAVSSLSQSQNHCLVLVISCFRNILTNILTACYETDNARAVPEI